MIRIDFDPEGVQDRDRRKRWEEWTRRAADAVREAVKAWEAAAPGEKPKSALDNRLWGEIKSWLLDEVFHGKCAYCETPRSRTRSSFHMDHFRPKNRVRHRIAGARRLTAGTCRDAAGKEIDHPGYFWLAYHWRNLLPCCELCNTAAGKKDQFPLLDASRYILHQELDDDAAARLRRPPYASERWPGFYYLDPVDLDRGGRGTASRPAASSPIPCNLGRRRAVRLTVPGFACYSSEVETSPVSTAHPGCRLSRRRREHQGRQMEDRVMKELESERSLDETEGQDMPEGIEALSDEDLEEVAGGWTDEDPPSPPPPGGGG